MKRIRKFFRAARDYFKGAYHEFRLVTWPTREQTTQYTILVTGTIVVATAFLTAFDFGMEKLVDKFLIR